MKSISFVYKDKDQLKDKLSIFSNEKNILIQIFDSKFDTDFTNKLTRDLLELLPFSEIMITTSIAGISDSNAFEGEITISVSIFRDTSVKVFSFSGDDDHDIAGQILSKVTDNTKLLILFGDKNKINCEMLLDDIATQSPATVIAGGIAGDDLSFQRIRLGDKNGIGDFSFICAVLDSKILKVYTNYIFEFIGIGTTMTVTSVDKNGIVKTINNMPVKEVYRKYLGDLVADNLPMSSFEFPLILKENGLSVGKVAIEIFDDGSARYSSDVKLGAEVGFGVRSIVDTRNKVSNQSKSLKDLKIEGIYLYLCATRYIYFKKAQLENQYVDRFDSVAHASGFFAHGEFFHINNNNYVFNVSSTLVALSEGGQDADGKYDSLDSPIQNTQSDMIIHSLSHLSRVANDDYEAMVKVFRQYKELLEESSMILYMNQKGVIVGVNKVFLDTSKYQKSNIIGRRLSNFISSDSKGIIENIWDCIKQHKTWKGTIKNIAQDGSIFYTRSIVKPIVDSKNNVLMYICGMDDITEYELKRQRLEDSIDAITEISFEKEKIIQEYQTLLDRSTAMVRLKKGHFIEVNKSCEQLFGYASGELINRHFSIVLDSSRNNITNMIDNIKKVLTARGYINTYIPCIDKNGNRLHIQAYIMTINTIDKEDASQEFVGILHNVTEIFEIQQELVNVQKEVIYAMGSISEGRSRETGNHVKRVAEYSYLLAKLYGLDETQAILIKTASPMHDIGKLAIPDAILNKPGKLTEEEFEIMKTHAQKGYDMLHFSDRPILKASAEIALTHHEWWNGNGYPNKLVGEDIPLFGRITSVADVFDALSHDRCYKKAWPMEEVIDYMLKMKDIQFQGVLVDLLVENLDEFIKIKTEFEDKF